MKTINQLAIHSRRALKGLSLSAIFCFGIAGILASGGNGDTPPPPEEKPGTLQFESVSYSVTEAAGAQVVLSVIRSGGSEGTVSVDYASQNVDANAGEDFTAVNDTLTWADGDSATQTISIDILNDDLAEPSEAFQVKLTNVSRASLGADTATITISDDDNPGSIQFSSAVYSAIEGTNPSVTITVSRSGGSSGAASVTYATSEGTAFDIEDFTSVSDTLSWDDGESGEKSFSVDITNDTVPESDESFNVTLSNFIGASQGSPATAAVNITDNDNAGTLAFASASYPAIEAPGASVTISVIRSGGSAGAASVGYITSGDSAVAPDDFIQSSGTLVWTDGDSDIKSFSIDISNDDLPENTESFNVALQNATGASLGTPNTTVVSITDDDVPGSIQFSDANFSVSEAAGSIAIEVLRVNGSGGAISVNYATQDGSATQPGDYTQSSGTLTWAAGDASSRFISIDIVNDTEIELTQSFSVVLSGDPLGSPSTAVVSILDNDAINVEGIVRAPNGALAFKQPALWQRMLTLLFGNDLQAALSDLVSPVAGAVVELYEVNAAGELQGGALASDTTDGNGSYSLTPLVDVLDSVKYIVRASSAGNTMDSRAIAYSVNVDPTTDATNRLVNDITANLSEISASEIQEMQTDIESLIPFVDKSSLTAANLSDRLYDAANSRVGQLNILRSKVAAGEICGHVQTAGGAALAGIVISVHDYGDRNTRATTYTDSSGDYCVNVPIKDSANPDGGFFDGNYIVGAINRSGDDTDPGISASEWLGNGNTHAAYDANIISVSDTNPVLNTDFSLDAGVRISGTIQGSGPVNLEGIRVLIEDFDTYDNLASTQTDANGFYQISVAPGRYLISARNTTTEAFGSEYYRDSLGINVGTQTRNFSDPVVGNAGDRININFALMTGFLLSGNVSDNGPVVDTTVKINVIDPSGDTASENVSTDRNGDYAIWLRSDSYNVYAYGQRLNNIFLQQNREDNFNAQVSAVTGQLRDAGGNPVRGAQLRIYQKVDATTVNLMAYASSDHYGNFSIYTNQIADHIMEARITRDSPVAGIVYIDKTQQLLGDVIAITALGGNSDIGEFTLPSGGVLTGHIYSDASTAETRTPMANFRVQVRDGGNQLENRFIQVKTKSDGSYTIALPATTYERVKMRDATNASTGNGNCNNIEIAVGQTKTLDYFDTDDICVEN